MQSWLEVTHIANAAPARPPPPPQPISTVAFDSVHDLIWVGDRAGRVASYMPAPGARLARYTAFQALTHGPVSGIVLSKDALWTSGPQGLTVRSRGGAGARHFAPDLADIAAMVDLVGSNDLVVASGGGSALLRLDVDRAVVKAELDSGPGSASVCALSRSSAFLAAGRSDGCVQLYDSSLAPTRLLTCHTGPISHLSVRDNLVVTCGRSVRKGGGGASVADPLVTVFDIRAMKSLPPLPFAAGASFVHLHPRLRTGCLVASASGQLAALDVSNLTTGRYFQVPLASSASSLTAIELSPSGDYAVLADSDGIVRLWSNLDRDPISGADRDIQFLRRPLDLEMPTAPSPTVYLSPNNLDTPLSSVGMPYYTEHLASAWHDNPSVFSVGMPPVAVDPAIKAVARQFEGRDMWMARTPQTNSEARSPLRNLAQPYRSVHTTANPAPKFLSEQQRAHGRQKKTSLDQLLVSHDAHEVPPIFRRLEIRYSKFGVQDFDFDFYNRTRHAGLEAQMANTYCNAVLQMLWAAPRFCNRALRFVATTCADQVSLLAELGLLFDMLYKAGGSHCRASNFVDALSSLPEAQALGLIYDDLNTSGPGPSKHALVQSLLRFLLSRVAAEDDELRAQDRLGPEDSVESLFGIHQTVAVRSLTCGAESIRSATVHDLEIALDKPQFSQCIQDSLERWTQTRGWCDKCRKYQMLGTLRSVRTLPPLLSLHVAASASPLTNPAAQFEVQPLRGKLNVREVPESASSEPAGHVYRLRAMVVEIAQHHLVCFARSGNQWHLFNDFLVKPVPADQVFDLSAAWKRPVVLLYEQVSSAVPFDFESWKQSMDTSLLYRDHLVHEGTIAKKSYQLLTPEERPGPGTLVAMDAEFVLMQQEEIEIRADGTKSLLRPKHLSLARVSVLRTGEKDKPVSDQTFTAFIDDYIATTRPIVDCLTSFSGIEPGDLDPKTSPRPLVTLQTSYKRLWILLNLGCVFVGHGLHNDFRTINIQVPAAQVIDTSDLYYLPKRQRRLSLKFLSWFVLNENVQTGNHDSIEDSRMALLLYYKYLDLKAKGEFEQTLARVYDEGPKYNFRPPIE